MSVETDRQSEAVEQEQAITVAVAEIAERRAVIEQAKGMLMVIYGIDEDAAFELLRWQSQHHNVKLRLLAEQIAQDFTELSRQRPPVDGKTYDELLVTAYTRVESPLFTDAAERMNARLFGAERAGE